MGINKAASIWNWNYLDHLYDINICRNISVYLDVSVLSGLENESHSVMSNSLWPMDYTVHGILQTRILEWVVFPFSRGSSQPRDWTQVFHIAGDYLPSEPPRKPKNTRGGSLSLLHWIFLTQELNRGLLHCRWNLYQLSYQGSLWSSISLSNPARSSSL